MRRSNPDFVVGAEWLPPSPFGYGGTRRFARNDGITERET
jgi:hypothetical protein